MSGDTATGIATATNENLKSIASKTPTFGEEDGLAFNLDRFFDKATGFSKSPEKPTDDRYNGQVTLGDQTIEVEGGEALYKGKLYKVGDDGKVFDSSLKAIGRIVDGKIEQITKISDLFSSNTRDQSRNASVPQAIVGRDGKPTGQFQGQDPSKPGNSRANPGGSQVRGTFDEISKLLGGNSDFNIEDLLVGGTVKAEKDEIKRGLAKKLLSFFS